MKPEVLKSWSLEIDYSRAPCLDADQKGTWALGTRLCHTRVDCGFTRRRAEVNFSSPDWLSYLRTQLTVFVGEICLRNKQIFSALFSRTIFSPEEDTLKRYKSKGICSIALKLGQ